MSGIDVSSAALLGILEGLTEFIPVSSTGHLILMRHAIGILGEKGEAFEVFIQLGAILAVLVLYWDRFRSLFDFRDGLHVDVYSPGPWRGVRAIALLAVGCAPVFILGAALGSTAHHYLGFPHSVATALIVWGVVMCGVEKTCGGARLASIEDVTLRSALFIGIFQCISLWPGISRSGSSIVGGILAGLDRATAAQFSFILAVPVMAAASAYKMLEVRSSLVAADIPAFAVGFLVSFVTAIVGIRFLMSLLSKWNLVPFGVYRIALGVAVLTFV